jgi:hypothetical protein
MHAGDHTSIAVDPAINWKPTPISSRARYALLELANGASRHDFQPAVSSVGFVAIDGRVLRRSFDKASSNTPFHIVGASVSGNVRYWQIAGHAKSKQITAVPKQLDALSLAETILTTDALNCRRPITKQIISQGDDLCL